MLTVICKLIDLLFRNFSCAIKLMSAFAIQTEMYLFSIKIVCHITLYVYLSTCFASTHSIEIFLTILLLPNTIVFLLSVIGSNSYSLLLTSTSNSLLCLIMLFANSDYSISFHEVVCLVVLCWLCPLLTTLSKWMPKTRDAVELWVYLCKTIRLFICLLVGPLLHFRLYIWLIQSINFHLHVIPVQPYTMVDTTRCSMYCNIYT